VIPEPAAISVSRLRLARSREISRDLANLLPHWRLLIIHVARKCFLELKETSSREAGMVSRSRNKIRIIGFLLLDWNFAPDAPCLSAKLLIREEEQTRLENIVRDHLYLEHLANRSFRAVNYRSLQISGLRPLRRGILSRCYPRAGIIIYA